MKRLIVLMAVMMIILQGCVMTYSTKGTVNGMSYETMKKFDYHTDDALIELAKAGIL